ncbi:hypothetical protein BU15DRAFT_71717 [Melanogaster broomeanus]|nr:hypothetical protein BU15DRAFT_71717 [Melanogaster broomeanus]
MVVSESRDSTRGVESDMTVFGKAAPVSPKEFMKLSSMEEPCVQFEETGHEIFDVGAFAGADRLLSMWPYLSKLPVLTRLGMVALDPRGLRSESWSGIPARPLMAGRPGARSQWHPVLKDREDPRHSSENMQAWMDHCYSTQEQIVAKVKKARDEAQEPLKYIYVMSNAPVPCIQDLAEALRGLGGLEHVESSRDLTLTWDQKYVAVALDMMAAQGAQLLIGNGWSSITSNVMMLRMVDGIAAGKQQVLVTTRGDGLVWWLTS